MPIEYIRGCGPSIWCVSSEFLWPAPVGLKLSVESGYIPTVTTLFSLANRVGHCQFCVMQFPGYITYGTAISLILDYYTYLELRSLQTAWHVACERLRCCFLQVFTAETVTCIRTEYMFI